MNNVWPKSLSEEAKHWNNESLTLPPIGTRCRLVLTTHEDISAEHLERDGKEVEIVSHIANGNLAVCVCYEHWARNDDGEWWVAAFNDRQFQPIKEPFWPSVNEDAAISRAKNRQQMVRYLAESLDRWPESSAECFTPGYGWAWHDVPPNCEFVLVCGDDEIGEMDWRKAREVMSRATHCTETQPMAGSEHYTAPQHSSPLYDDSPLQCGDTSPVNDAVNHPSHYTQGGVECIDALEAATVGKSGIEAICTANVIKYLWRYERKNGVEDVRKARWYLERLIKELEQ